MRSLVESLITKKSIKNIVTNINRFGITEKDLTGNISEFPIGVVVRMLEEQEKQGNKPDVKVFQKDFAANANYGGFEWDETVDGLDFWFTIIEDEDFDVFYEKYPKYKRYDAI